MPCPDKGCRAADYIMQLYDIIYRSAGGGEIEINDSEALRYLGYGRDVPSGQISELYTKCRELVLQCVCYKAVYTLVPLTVCGNAVDLGRFSVKSANLSKNLSGCDSAFVFAATAGMGIDRLMAKYEHCDSAAQVIISAIGSACVESWCDVINAEMSSPFKTRPRFSPGYGDLSLDCQPDIFSLLQAQKRIGLTLTDSYFIKPVKSVTAIVGVKE